MRDIGGAQGVRADKALSEPRWFNAMLDGQDYTFEVNKKGDVRALGPEIQDVIFDRDCLASLNLAAQELRPLQQQLWRHVRQHVRSSPSSTFTGGLLGLSEP